MTKTGRINRSPQPSPQGGEGRVRGNLTCETTSTLFQEEKVRLIEVAIPLPIEDPFTYQVPECFQDQIQAGCRVRIPFKNRSMIGYIVNQDANHAVKNPKVILEVLDPEPVLSDHHLRLARWMGGYYFSSWGEAIQNMLPKILKEGHKVKKGQDSSEALSHSGDPKPEICLNEEQEKAFARLHHRILEGKYSEVFIFGVTG